MKHNWEYKRLGEVCSILDSLRKPVTKSDRKPGPYPYYGASGVQDYVSDYIFDGDFLLVGEDGAKWGANDKTAFSISGKSWVNNHAHILDFKDSPVSQKLVEYVLCSRDLNKIITGAVVPKLTQKNLAAISIPIPPMEVQEQIVAELDKINEVIEDCRELLRNLDTLAQSLFYDYFGDPVTNPKGWEFVKLGTTNDISSAKRVLVEDVVEDGVPFIRGTELAVLSKQNSFNSNIFSMFITPEHYERVKAITGVPKLHDLLIPSINSEGYVWEVNTTEPLYFKDGRVLWVHVNHDVYSSSWLKFALSIVIKEKYANLSRGAVFAELTLIFLRNLELPVPPLALQEQFADRIEQIEAQKRNAEETIATMQTLLDSRMDHWFN